MSDPVWFGNAIIPRWEALAVLGFAVVMAILVAVVAVAIVAAFFRR